MVTSEFDRAEEVRRLADEQAWHARPVVVWVLVPILALLCSALVWLVQTCGK